MFGKKKLMNGYDAIIAEFDRIYPNINSETFATKLCYELGGDPLPEIKVYDADDSLHFVTFGLTDLYEKTSDDKEINGFGMEFTLRLKKGCYKNEENEKKCICKILQTLASLTFTSGEIFMPYEYIYTGQTAGMDSEQLSNITGFITVPDIKAQPIETAFGKTEFVQFIGVTNSELKAVIDEKLTVEQLYKKLKTDLTDYKRKSVI